ncbi:MAG: peptidase modulator of gyrase [Gemmatimonadetes bacterium]|nr:peptidase modulator of gyrase [Gemmatimonadota bacterium]
MSISRRDFVRTASAAAALSAIGSRADALSVAPSIFVPTYVTRAAEYKDLAMKAIDAAKGAGADYADVRIAQYRSQFVQTRERRVQGLADTETAGIGIRTMVNGAWGFAATADLSVDAVVATARKSAAQAKANRAALTKPITLAPYGKAQTGDWKSPIKTDPFSIPVADKVALLLAANDAALKVKGVRFATSGMSFLREEKTFANTEGSYTTQTLYRCSPQMNITAVSADNTDFQTRSGNEIAPRGLGYEHVVDADMIRNATRWAEEAVQKLSAKPVDVGRYDLVLHPSHLWLTIHESVAHPTELDRALGFEANYAGTSFVSPPEKMLGQLKFGSKLMNIRADRNQVGSLSACGWDDEGVVPESFDIIRNGVFVDYQTTREQAPYLDWWYRKQGKPVRSHGNSYSQSWSDVQFQRMPNVNLLPGEKDHVWDDLIAATDKGIAIMGDGSFSIDQQRYNAQFGGQVFYEIKGGKIVGMLKDVAYQMRTPEFWSSLDMIGGKRSYFLGGANNDGKGQPSQSNAVSHGCVPSRFKQINVINTGRTA